MCKIMTATSQEFDLVDLLMDMGLRTTGQEASSTLEMLFPTGTVGFDLTHILIEVFSHIESKRKWRILHEVFPEKGVTPATNWQSISASSPANDDYSI